MFCDDDDGGTQQQQMINDVDVTGHNTGLLGTANLLLQFNKRLSRHRGIARHYIG